ncbi:MAG: 50S ribosomal protein L35 [Candidatus Saccharimonadales bacterium]
MPKMKTHSGASKRVKVTGSGKLRRRRAFRSHMLSKKRNSRKRNFTREFDFSDGDNANVNKMLGGK